MTYSRERVYTFAEYKLLVDLEKDINKFITTKVSKVVDLSIKYRQDRDYYAYIRYIPQ